MPVLGLDKRRRLRRRALPQAIETNTGENAGSQDAQRRQESDAPRHPSIGWQRFAICPIDDVRAG
jgi:hypothetical protein